MVYVACVHSVIYQAETIPVLQMLVIFFEEKRWQGKLVEMLRRKGSRHRFCHFLLSHAKLG